MLLFEIETLLRWKGPPAGIPRVIAQLSRQFLCSEQVRFVSFDQRKCDFDFLNEDQKKALTSLMSAGTLGAPEQCFGMEHTDSNPRKISSSDVFLGCGTFWGNPRYAKSLARLKQKTGCFVSYLIHDLIPILLPQTYGKGLPEAFTASLVDLLWICDHIFAVSTNTQRDLAEFIRLNQINGVAVTTVRLGDSPLVPLDPAELKPVKEFPNGFVLTVGTIEVRKNHRLLYEVWRRLAKVLGAKCPALMIVGRQGWLTKDLILQMGADPLVNRLIRIRSDLDDFGLERAYANALFTIYPSYYEGWGLPVAESLARGRLCLASKTSSIPEVAGTLIEYFDPYSIDEAYRLILKYLTGPELLRMKEAVIRNHYKPRSWKMTASQFLGYFSKKGLLG